VAVARRTHCSKQQWGSFKAQFGTFEVAVARGTFALFETAVGIFQSTVPYLRSSSCERNVRAVRNSSGDPSKHSLVPSKWQLREERSRCSKQQWGRTHCSKQQWGSFKAQFGTFEVAVARGTFYAVQNSSGDPSKHCSGVSKQQLTLEPSSGISLELWQHSVAPSQQQLTLESSSGVK
jgi:hypothetical protein